MTGDEYFGEDTVTVEVPGVPLQTLDPDRMLSVYGPELYAAYNTMLALERRWVPAVSGQGREESHPYVSYPLGKFLAGMRVISRVFAETDRHRIEPRRFIDLGCGIGEKVVLAAQLSYRADGIDFVPEYVDAARDLVGPLGGHIYQCDLMEFGEYHDYDLVYAYRPLIGDAAMLRLADKVIRNTAPRTILYFPTCPVLAEDPRLEPLASAEVGVWMKR